ncbi:MAG: alpha/beta fold hydrolase [Acidiferrobacterales bacterium]
MSTKTINAIYKKFFYMLLIAPLFALMSMSVQAASLSDRAKEKRWEQQIVPDIMVGNAIKLNASGVEFLGLYTPPANGKSRGAVIILHGNGVHPAWPAVIEPLRTELPEHGWHTLSLQMPILPNGAVDKDYVPLFPEVPARIQAGVDFLKKKGIKHIVLTGHSLGTTMATYYLADARDPVVDTFVLVSGGPGVITDKRMNEIKNLGRVHGVSVLDIYGTEDFPYVIDSVIKRKTLDLAKHGNRYTSFAIKGADHFYRDVEPALVQKFVQWIDQEAAR